MSVAAPAATAGEGRPRVAFVLQTALGWSTYRRQLEAVLAGRGDIAAMVLPVATDRRGALFLKRNNMSRADHLFRRRDPIDHFRAAGGAAIRRALGEFGAQAVHYAAHWPAAATAFQAGAAPFTCALDNTRAGIEASIPRGAWNAADCAREGALLRRAAHVYPMSGWAAQSLVADCGVAEDRVTVMPPSLALDRFAAPAAAPARAAAGPLRIVFIGNDFLRKGGDRLAGWLAGPLAGLAELHIVSSDPAAEAMRAAPGVVFHGRVPNDALVGELLPAMDALCLPTRSDMSPQVLVEAAAAGLATVASDLGGIPDLVADGETGLLVAPHDDAGFVAALRTLAGDRARTAAMGAAGRLLAARRFDAYANFNRLIDRLAALATSPIDERTGP